MGTSVEVARTGVSWPGPGGRPGLTRAHRKLLRRELGWGPPRPRTPERVRVTSSRLTSDVRERLAGVVGDSRVRTDPVDRLRRAGGMSYLDLLARRESAEVSIPDAVVLPATHDEVLGVLRVCAAYGIGCVPYGGGTSVVGGVDPRDGPSGQVVTLDLQRMDALVALDEESGTATVQPGMTGPQVEERLGARGYTLGHFPQSWECSTVGGWVATRSAGQASTGYGRIDDLVTALRVATPAGTLALGRAPRSAAGPDLRCLFTGSEGTLGVITEATLRVRRTPSVRRYEGWSFPDFGAGLSAFRRLAQDGVTPDVLRLSDVEETRTTLALAGGPALFMRTYQQLRGHPRGCLAIVGWEGTSARVVHARRLLGRAVLADAGGVGLGARVGDAWLRGRYDGPYLRDTLLDAGLLVETLESATDWAGLGDLHQALNATIRQALADTGTPPLVLTHVSHAYPTGGSLYLTIIARRAEDEAAEQWQRAKRAAMATITAAGATITHHHAVGADHAPWLPEEIGDLGVEVLRAIKRTVDPTGVLNPGVLLLPTD